MDYYSKKEIVEVTLPKTKKELNEFDLNKVLFFQNSSFSPNPDCFIMNFQNHPLKEYLKDFVGMKIKITIEEIKEVESNVKTN